MPNGRRKNDNENNRPRGCAFRVLRLPRRGPIYPVQAMSWQTTRRKGQARKKQDCEEIPEGRVKVALLPNSQLSTDREELEGVLQRGSRAAAGPSYRNFGPLGVREFELFDIPY